MKMNFYSFQLFSVGSGTLIPIEDGKKKHCQLKMTSSAQISHSLFWSDSGFLEGVGEASAQSSKILNSASGLHLPSQRFPLPLLLPRWHLGVGGSGVSWSRLWVLLSGSWLHPVVSALTSVLAAATQDKGLKVWAVLLNTILAKC